MLSHALPGLISISLIPHSAHACPLILALGWKLRGMGNPDQSPAGLDLSVAVKPAACIMHRDTSTEASMSFSGCGEITLA